MREFRVVIFSLMLALALPAIVGQERALSLDPAQPLERRVEDLLARMTLEEKVG